jgi:hypothetical protein
MRKGEKLAKREKASGGVPRVSGEVLADAEFQTVREEGTSSGKEKPGLLNTGEFLMGIDPQQGLGAYANEQPQHLLYLPDYYPA